MNIMKMIDLTIIKKIQKANPGSELLITGNVGHYVQYTYPDIIKQKNNKFIVFIVF